jgi:hypothetical protein
MSDVKGFEPSDDVPEADAVEQHQSADFDDDSGDDTPYLSTTDHEADEADLIEQSFVVVPVPDDERDAGY